MTQGRIIIVSNRLPCTVTASDGQLQFSESVGGLATGLRSFLNTGSGNGNYLWVGWPGSTIPDDLRGLAASRLLAEHHSHPVFLSQEEIEKFYHGFCNKTIWPLFHYFSSFAEFNAESWKQYVSVNSEFCRALEGLIQKDDLIWIHDYHLMLLPQMLRERFPGLSIGFFLHIPFPNYELFRLLPSGWRRELLLGLVASDLIAFHTFDYMQDFLRCVLRILGIESNLGRLIIGERLVRVETLPMGIHFDRFQDAAAKPEILSEREALKSPLGEVKIVLSIDRLDYSKGIIHRLLGFETLLDSTPELRGKVTLIVVIVPSRVGVDQYDLMKKNIEELIGKINGKFGTTGWTPIIYQYKSLSFPTLVAMYAMSDVALVTPLRDGMNLIAKEYLASRRDDSGVLIISEMAGAAKELGEAIIINPNNREEIAEALRQALTMPADEQRRRNQIMRRRLSRYNVVRWANDFLELLSGARQTDRVFFGKLLNEPTRRQLLHAYAGAQRRLLLLDYDGTLVGFHRRPSNAKPGKDVLALLQSLGNDPSNETVLISGRTRGTLDEWFGELPLSLVGEHGAWIRSRGGEWTLARPLANDWKTNILPLLERYVDRLPGSSIEEKDYAVAYHFRAADQEHARVAAQELVDDLITFTANIDVQVLQGNKVVEVRAGGVNKGIAAQRWLQKSTHDFVLAIGDDWTDEDLFGALPEGAFTLHVGTQRTRARHVLRNPTEVLDLLRSLPAPPMSG